ncbi:hypothetical protein CDAR_515841 [Caerostris darwini]|uniref:Uncharacterized protein n=1 Tax=Caerostris darwini TaxID=1538125 RepID=A0AAV4PVP7_9ARAC|nr:hypothetical protein CDAR_515841 [Caerostris darwini]
MSWTDDEKWLSFTLGSQDSGVLNSIEGFAGNNLQFACSGLCRRDISVNKNVHDDIYKKESKRRATKYCSWTTSVTRSRQISGKHISVAVSPLVETT